MGGTARVDRGNPWGHGIEREAMVKKTGISRRNFLQGLAVGAVGAGTLALGGCGGTPQASTPSEKGTGAAADTGSSAATVSDKREHLLSESAYFC